MVASSFTSNYLEMLSHRWLSYKLWNSQILFNPPLLKKSLCQGEFFPMIRNPKVRNSWPTISFIFPCPHLSPLNMHFSSNNKSQVEELKFYIARWKSNFNFNPHTIFFGLKVDSARMPIGSCGLRPRSINWFAMPCSSSRNDFLFPIFFYVARICFEKSRDLENHKLLCMCSVVAYNTKLLFLRWAT